ncbi:penicillin-binding protein 3 [Clostridium sediminicola]|uniref:penicillin-binding transpeptidase domain-containing protein n=1 Tax=Clostridium sediminicola TaxID=3114879 RepID=UPI0031F220A6
MKKINLTIIVCTILIIFLTGCSKTKSPLEEFDECSQLWISRNYKSMYDCLSTAAKNSISEENFENVYEEFYKNIGLESISIKNLADEEKLEKIIKKEEKITLPIEVKLQTVNGEKEYSTDVIMVKEDIDGEDVWNVDWSYDLIYKGMIDSDKVEISYDSPIRGEIIDRNGTKLAQNGKVVRVGIVPGRLGDMKEEIINDMAKVFNISVESINKKLSASWIKDDSFVDILKISEDNQNLIEELYLKNKGATYKEMNGRVYPYKDVTAHLTGYIGYVNEKQLDDLKTLGFTKNDKIGKTGLEKIFDEQLRGVPGKKISIIDKSGNSKEVIFEKKVVDGEDVKLTIDIETQIKLYNELKNEQGVAACMNYNTGEVVALVSSPSYDPNQFILGISSDEYNNLLNDTSKPLMNRFTKVYAPGSVLKPITAAIALNENKIDDNFTIDVKGLKWQKDSSWGKYFITRVKDSGVPVDLEKAMVYSDNIYFGRVALEIGGDTFIKKAKEFGIGQELKIRYGTDKSQLGVNDKIDNEILLADTGYGQGKVLVNILNMPKAYSAFVNSGRVVEPKLIADGKEAEIDNSIISEEVANKIFGLITKVIEDENGTGHQAFISGKTIGGKTGTAEIGVNSDNSQKKELGWFVAVDKDSKTPYITTMMIENVENKGGSHYVVPKVRCFIESY